MVLDTGASSVVLTHDAAVAAGLPVEMIHYTVSVDTANGRAQAAPVTLDRIAVGSIVERQVPALIAPPGQLTHESARHELPVPAARLGGARRQGDDARGVVVRLQVPKPIRRERRNVRSDKRDLLRSPWKSRGHP